MEMLDERTEPFIPQAHWKFAVFLHFTLHCDIFLFYKKIILLSFKHCFRLFRNGEQYILQESPSKFSWDRDKFQNFLMGVWFNADCSRFALENDQFNSKSVRLLLKSVQHDEESVQFDVKMVCIGKNVIYKREPL